MKVLTRYLLGAHIGPFLFALVALTGVILINTLAKELANLAGKGLPLRVVLEFFVLSLPANVALTLPMAVLVSVLYTFSSLAVENEITALRAGGVDLRRAVLPLLLLAALIAGGMVWFNDRVLPASNYRWRVLMTDVAQTRPLLALNPQTLNPIRTDDGQTPYYLEAQEIDAATGALRRVTIYDVSDSRITRTINADSGRMAFNPQRTDLLLTLFDGDVREVDFGEPHNFQVVGFQQQVMRMIGVSDQLERTAESSYRTDRDMTVGMMQARIDSLGVELADLIAAAGGTDTANARTNGGGQPAQDARLQPTETPSATAQDGDDELADRGPVETEPGASTPAENGSPPQQTDGANVVAASEPTSERPPADTTGQRASSELTGYSATRARNISRQVRELQVEIQKKFSIAGATLVFVLIGIPIALRFPRGGIGMVIGVSLGMFGIYYVGLIGGETLGDGGYVRPAAAMWATNVIFGFLGIMGFLRLGREQGTNRGGRELPRWLRLSRLRKGSRGSSPG